MGATRSELESPRQPPFVRRLSVNGRCQRAAEELLLDLTLGRSSLAALPPQSRVRSGVEALRLLVSGGV